MKPSPLTVLEHPSHSRTNPPAPTYSPDESFVNAPCETSSSNMTWPSLVPPPSLYTMT
jgi:hypothetical protein